MLSNILSVLLTIYAVHALAKFGFFFLLSYERRRAALDRAYRGRVSATHVVDLVLLGLVLAIVTLLAVAGINYRSFLGGLLTGMTLIQLYFHQFSVPLSNDAAPSEPVSPIKTMSYAIQAMPARPWKELIVMALLLLWSIAGLARQAGWIA